MRKQICSLCSLATLVVMVGILSTGTLLFAQQGSSDHGDAAQPQPGQTQQPPAQSPDQSSQPAPDSPAQTAPAQAPEAQSQPSDTQSFAGTIVKAGDKYVLQDSDSGKTYDIDRQDLAREHEGKKVHIAGTLDPNGKLIHVK
ncbi:MAG: DUF5818 domain-containing protein [Terriglobales bacterium]